MNPEKRIGHLLTELGIEGDLKEALRSVIIESMPQRNKNKFKFCKHCLKQFEQYPHYCQDHIMVCEQTRYWIDDQAYNASKIVDC